MSRNVPPNMFANQQVYVSLVYYTPDTHTFPAINPAFLCHWDLLVDGHHYPITFTLYTITTLPSPI
jgi:hypothetical protein